MGDDVAVLREDGWVGDEFFGVGLNDGGNGDDDEVDALGVEPSGEGFGDGEKAVGGEIGGEVVAGGGDGESGVGMRHARAIGLPEDETHLFAGCGAGGELVGGGVFVGLEERLAVGAEGCMPLVPIAIGGEAALQFDGLPCVLNGGVA